MKTVRSHLLAVTLASAAASGAIAQSPSSDDTSVNRLVDRFVAAQQAYDQRTLGELTTPDYIEVSPVGDVDTRDEMLGFYAPDKKRPAPPITVAERTLRPFRNGAILVARLTLAVPNRPVQMRATYVARRTAGGWKLAAAHYTPIRSS